MADPNYLMVATIEREHMAQLVWAAQEVADLWSSGRHPEMTKLVPHIHGLLDAIPAAERTMLVDRAGREGVPDLEGLRRIYLDRFGVPLERIWHTVESAVPEPPASYFRQWEGWPVPITFWIGTIQLQGMHHGSLVEQLVLRIVPRRTATGILQQRDIEEIRGLRTGQGGQVLPTERWEIQGDILIPRRLEWLATVANPREPKPSLAYWDRAPGGFIVPVSMAKGDILARGLRHEARGKVGAHPWRVVYAIDDGTLHMALATTYDQARALHHTITDGGRT